MEQLIIDRLHDNLTRLKLSRAVEVLDTIIEQANEHKTSYLGFLDHLLEEEVAAKEGRRIQTAMKTAGLPSAKTIEEYDFSFHPHLDRGVVMELFDLTFISKKKMCCSSVLRESARPISPYPWPSRPVTMASRFTSPPWTP